MTNFDWKAILKTAAPLLGTAIGGPLGAAAGALVAKALGGDEAKATPEDLAKLVQSITPEQLLALKNAEQEWALKLKELELDSVEKLEALATQDRDSARSMAIKTGDITPRVLAYAVVLIWALIQWFLLREAFNQHELPERMTFLVGRVLGTLDTVLIMVFTYFYGTTAGSRNKDELLHQSTPIKK